MHTTCLQLCLTGTCTCGTNLCNVPLISRPWSLAPGLSNFLISCLNSHPSCISTLIPLASQLSSLNSSFLVPHPLSHTSLTISILFTMTSKWSRDESSECLPSPIVTKRARKATERARYAAETTMRKSPSSRQLKKKGNIVCRASTQSLTEPEEPSINKQDVNNSMLATYYSCQYSQIFRFSCL